MTRIAILCAAALLMSQNAAAQLPGLIDQNVKDAKAAADRLTHVQRQGTPQLWIHVRNDAQRRAVQNRLDWFRMLQVDGRRLNLRPLELVKSGPPQSQLRFFKSADRAQAQALLVELRKAVPLVALADMSRQYGEATWIDSGHFELWLALSVTRISVP